MDKRPMNLISEPYKIILFKAQNISFQRLLVQKQITLALYTTISKPFQLQQKQGYLALVAHCPEIIMHKRLINCLFYLTLAYRGCFTHFYTQKIDTPYIVAIKTMGLDNNPTPLLPLELVNNSLCLIWLQILRLA